MFAVFPLTKTPPSWMLFIGMIPIYFSQYSADGVFYSRGRRKFDEKNYGLMHHIAVSGRPIRGGFIHVPYLPEQAVRHPGAPSMALDRIVLGLELAIGVLT